MSDAYEFSSLVVPIDDQVKGLVRMVVVSRLGKLLELEVEIHQLKLNTNDPDLVRTLMKSVVDRLDNNPSGGDDLFNSFSSNVVRKHTYNYYGIEDLVQRFGFLREVDRGDPDARIRVPRELFDVGFTLLVRDVRRLKRFVDALLFNYHLIVDTIRYVDRRLGEGVGIGLVGGVSTTPTIPTSGRLFEGEIHSTNNKNSNSAVDSTSIPTSEEDG